MTREEALTLIINVVAQYTDEEEERLGIDIRAEDTDEDIERKCNAEYGDGAFEFTSAQRIRDISLEIKIINEEVR